MKASATISVAGLVVIAIGFWIGAQLIGQSISDAFGAQPIPTITATLIMHPSWILVYPLPWVVGLYVFVRKRNPKIEDALLIIAMTIFGICVLVTLFLIASILPWLPRFPRLE